MASGLSPAQISTITTTLSPARMATFQTAPGFQPGADVAEKYSWHALTSGAFFVSLHMCEVAVRNAIDTALTITYGADWPWRDVFANSLPTPTGQNFKPKNELFRARAKFAPGATGKVVAELKFAFWCHMLTRRYQNRIWDPHIRTVFPYLPAVHTATSGRQAIHSQLDSLRHFRNRIAHHEPILTEPLANRQQSLQTLVAWRCADLANWHATWQTLSAVLTAKP